MVRIQMSDSDFACLKFALLQFLPPSAVEDPALDQVTYKRIWNKFVSCYIPSAAADQLYIERV